MKPYFTVSVGNTTDMQGHPAPDDTCEHKHRTLETAEACRDRLRDGGRSAKWYNARLVAGGCSTASGFRSVADYMESVDYQ